ncbi:hypothetical protein KUCAC02_037144 [Chaenocephalus aceratus]|nr:hypothetical protein KUCAC02_037144 [Chaenocephalus aceratus]
MSPLLQAAGLRGRRCTKPRLRARRPSCRVLILGGASVNVVAVDSITPLHEACLRGQDPVCPPAAGRRSPGGCQERGRQHPAVRGLLSGESGVCEAPSERGAKSNPALTSRTPSPLHEACMGGKEDCVKLLIAMGANLEAYDIYYGTPLHVACANEHTECVKCLLNAGAKVNAARLHETPLHHAAKNKQVEMVEILVEFGAKRPRQGSSRQETCRLHNPQLPLCYLSTVL